jgi:hypothetical protein
MAGLVPAIHVFRVDAPQDMDARDKRGHDEEEKTANPKIAAWTPISSAICSRRSAR